MKKFFTIVGMLSLVMFSFFFSERTVSVVKEQDDIMIKIRSIVESYKIIAKESIINEDTIIPGKNGKEVDVNASYASMKRVGYFDDNLLKFNDIKPKISLDTTFNKYIISGNEIDRKVSLIFLVDNNTNINSLVDNLNKKNTKANFFVDGAWLEKNETIITDLYKNGHSVGNLSYNNDYSDSSFIWMNTIIKKVIKQNKTYCYVEDKNKEVLDICALQKNYTIIPNIIYNDNIINIKNNIKNGSIISFKYSKKLENELGVIINYINSKGYSIVNLNDLLSENV